MNKGGLIAEVSKRTGLSKADVGRVVDASIDSIRETVVKGERVTLADFGTFERKRRNQRIARNPRKPDVPDRGAGPGSAGVHARQGVPRAGAGEGSAQRS